MNAAEIFWTIVLGVSFIVFFGIAALVSLKGAGDIRELFHHLSQSKGSGEKDN